MKYQVVYGKAPMSAWFDTLTDAIGFAERHQTLTDAPAVWEYTDRSGSMVWPTADQAAYIAKRYSTSPQTGPITLADAMARAGITQTSLSRNSGVPLRTVQKILSGETKFSNLTALNAMRLAEALNVDIRDLIVGESARTE